MQVGGKEKGGLVVTPKADQRVVPKSSEMKGERKLKTEPPPPAKKATHSPCDMCIVGCQNREKIFFKGVANADTRRETRLRRSDHQRHRP